MSTLRPFERMAFRDLPNLPTRPHRYTETAAHTLEMNSAPFGRIGIHYREWGSGPPLLLIHGLMTTSYSWRYVLDGLGAHYRLIMPDLPGCGRSDKPANTRFDARALSTWIGEFQRELGISGQRVVGNSLGGYLCMRLACDQPNAISRLVNIHSPGFPQRRLYALRTALSIAPLRWGLEWWIRRSPERWAHQNVHYFDETLKSIEESNEYGAPLAQRSGTKAFTSYLKDALSPVEMADFIEVLTARRAAKQPFPVPLMLLYSRTDPLVPPVIGEQLHALIPDARMVWLDDTSHFAHVDSPARVIEPVLSFLNSD